MSFVCFEPQDGASGLVPHPHRLGLHGRPEGLCFPPLCAACGAAATERIEVTKVFRRADSEGPTTYAVASASVPFCAGCTAAHRAAATAPTLLQRLASGLVGAEMLGAIFPAIGAAFLVWLALGSVRHDRGSAWLVELGLAACFGLIAWAQGASVWKENLRWRVPAQTDVTRSFDFSDDVSSVFERGRFVCTLRNAGFAAAFEALNADRAYRPHSPEAIAERRRSRRLTWAFGAAMLLFAAWSFWKDGFG